MGMFDKFFGVIDPALFAPILAILYFAIGLVFTILCFGRCKFAVFFHFIDTEEVDFTLFFYLSRSTKPKWTNKSS